MWGLRKQQAFEQIKQEIAREVALGKSEHDVMEGTLHGSRGECKKYPGRLEESHWGTGVWDTKDMRPVKHQLKKSSCHLMKEFELLQKQLA